MLLVLTSSSKIDPAKSTLINTVDDPIVSLSCYQYKKRSESYYVIKLYTRYDNTHLESHDSLDVAKNRLKEIMLICFSLITQDGADRVIELMPFVESEY